MKIMRKYFVFFVLIFFSILSTKADILGETNPIPYKVYSYNFDIAVGMSIWSDPYIWKVTNGKIMDANGNFTLTSLSVDKSFDPIYVIWECADIGKIDYIGSYSESLDVQIRQCKDLAINNEIFSSSAKAQYEWTYITMKDVTIESEAHVNVNGYKSVSILPPFYAKLGSNVRIYNDMMSNIYMPKERINSKATTNVDENINLLNKTILYQNTPNPLINYTTIRYYAPESSTTSYIQINDMLGNLVKKLPLAIGENETIIQKGELATGIYVYSLILDGKLIDSKRMIVNK